MAEPKNATSSAVDSKSKEKLAIDAPGGFLCEWWSVFWDIFISRTNDKHSESAAAYIEAQQIKAKEQQQLQMQQLQLMCQAQLHPRDPNHPSLGGPVNAIGSKGVLGQSNESALAAKMYEERMKHPNAINSETSQPLLDSRMALLKSATNHPGQLVQGNHGSDIKSEVNLGGAQRSMPMDPSSIYGQGIMQSKPGIANTDEQLGKDFLGSWKSMPVTEDDAMDFSFGTISKGKKKTFNSDKLDMDFNVDSSFDELPSFKMDMPDLDFSSPSKEAAIDKENHKEETTRGKQQEEKKDRFTSSFNFNEDSKAITLESNEISSIQQALEGGKTSKKAETCKDGIEASDLSDPLSTANGANPKAETSKGGIGPCNSIDDSISVKLVPLQGLAHGDPVAGQGSGIPPEKIVDTLVEERPLSNSAVSSELDDQQFLQSSLMDFLSGNISNQETVSNMQAEVCTQGTRTNTSSDAEQNVDDNIITTEGSIHQKYTSSTLSNRAVTSELPDQQSLQSSPLDSLIGNNTDQETVSNMQTEVYSEAEQNIYDKIITTEGSINEKMHWKNSSPPSESDKDDRNTGSGNIPAEIHETQSVQGDIILKDISTASSSEEISDNTGTKNDIQNPTHKLPLVSSNRRDSLILTRQNFLFRDMDFNVDSNFNKLPSFKMDMPSSPSKETAIDKEKYKEETTRGKQQEKKDRFTSFNFNELDGFDCQKSEDSKPIALESSEISSIQQALEGGKTCCITAKLNGANPKTETSKGGIEPCNSIEDSISVKLVPLQGLAHGDPVAGEGSGIPPEKIVDTLVEKRCKSRPLSNSTVSSELDDQQFLQSSPMDFLTGNISNQETVSNMQAEVCTQGTRTNTSSDAEENVDDKIITTEGSIHQKYISSTLSNRAVTSELPDQQSLHSAKVRLVSSNRCSEQTVSETSKRDREAGGICSRFSRRSEETISHLAKPSQPDSSSEVIKAESVLLKCLRAIPSNCNEKTTKSGIQTSVNPKPQVPKIASLHNSDIVKESPDVYSFEGVSAQSPLESLMPKYSDVVNRCKNMAIVGVVGAPLERMRFLLQNQGELLKTGRLTQPYAGMFDCFSRTIKTEGVLSLWRGNTARVSALACSAVLTYCAAPVDRSYPIDSELLYLGFFGVRAISSAAGLSVVYPLYHAATRMAIDVQSGRQFDGFRDVCKKTLRMDGPLGLYRGYPMMLTGMAIASVFTTTFDPWKRFERDIKRESIGYGLLCCGMFARYPFETASRRMTTSSIRYKGSRDACALSDCEV
ncbi:hypothetical protein CCACVL1_31044 [Corchorus capsularis]|uniref:Mitochondrial substrate/solute carrier n=1 Tax=Corchorus capsularis TaxID=210143 RepID=A0A1R3FU51_COCAP|nr:hypothetical protein CCACVL1_31044 [Corchorus capsularis]